MIFDFPFTFFPPQFSLTAHPPPILVGGPKFPLNDSRTLFAPFLTPSVFLDLSLKAKVHEELSMGRPPLTFCKILFSLLRDPKRGPVCPPHPTSTRNSPSEDDLLMVRFLPAA